MYLIALDWLKMFIKRTLKRFKVPWQKNLQIWSRKQWNNQKFLKMSDYLQIVITHQGYHCGMGFRRKSQKKRKRRPTLHSSRQHLEGEVVLEANKWLTDFSHLTRRIKNRKNMIKREKQRHPLERPREDNLWCINLQNLIQAALPLIVRVRKKIRSK
jgi:hypothetical protein